MTTEQYLQMSALELGKAIREGRTTSPEVVEAFFQHIEKTDETYSCFISLTKELALEKAQEVQARIRSGEFISDVAGVPIALKDNICTKGQRTTCASKMLENFVPPYSATVYRKLEDAGMVLVGKLNMDEFAMGATTETSYFGITKNPWGIDRVPGGSSGGSAAAVAARQVPAALGSDTGGSIRQPASYCGVSGIKPTYGRVSRFGVVAFASSLDQVGPIARDIFDCAAVLNVISGKDEKDQTSVETKPVDIEKARSMDPKTLRIGVPREYFSEGIEPDVADAVRQAIETFRQLGAQIEEFDLPIVEYAVPTYCIISAAEASSNLARYDGVKYGYRSPEATDLIDLYVKSRSEGFGMEVKRRIMLGNFVLSSGYYDAYYRKALQAKGLIKKAFDEAFSKYDVIVGPVAPTTAQRLGETLQDPLKMYLGDIYTVLANIVGLPAASIPCGFDAKGLPVGLQILAKHYDEQTLVGAAAVYQNHTEFHKRRPAEVIS